MGTSCSIERNNSLSPDGSHRGEQVASCRQMKVLFVGESWFGSCARSMKEALGRHSEVLIDEVNEDLCFPKSSMRSMRLLNRLLRNEYRKELLRQIVYRASLFSPDVIVFYKGSQ